MLVMFRFKNYGSFKGENVFDMRAVKAYKEHPYNLEELNNDNLLIKVAAVYGSNASGKTNFVEAYKTFARIVRHSFQNNNKQDEENEETFLSAHHFPYLFDATSAKANTEFEAVYIYEGNEYRYGFEYNSTTIEYEWLYKRSLQTNRQSTIFEREAHDIRLGRSVKTSLEKYSSDIDDDVLALSFFGSLKLRTKVFIDTLYCVLSILPVSFACEKNSEYMRDLYFRRDFTEEEKPNLLSFLSAIDVGIKDISVERQDKKIKIFSYHENSEGSLTQVPIEIESDGTLRAITLYSLVRIAALNGKGLLIDEFNSQLHPLLQKYIVDLIYENGAEGQLIYTTHDTTFLDQKYIRRDQVWFVSKDKKGVSSLYSLADFKPRNDLNLANAYLSGAYGGIPILKDFSFGGENNGE